MFLVQIVSRSNSHPSDSYRLVRFGVELFDGRLGVGFRVASMIYSESGVGVESRLKFTFYKSASLFTVSWINGEPRTLISFSDTGINRKGLI